MQESNILYPCIGGKSSYPCVLKVIILLSLVLNNHLLNLSFEKKKKFSAHRKEAGVRKPALVKRVGLDLISEVRMRS